MTPCRLARAKLAGPPCLKVATMVVFWRGEDGVGYAEARCAACAVLAPQAAVRACRLPD